MNCIEALTSYAEEGLATETTPWRKALPDHAGGCPFAFGGSCTVLRVPSVPPSRSAWETPAGRMAGRMAEPMAGWTTAGCWAGCRRT